MTNLDQECGRHAAERILDTRFPNFSDDAKNALKNYRSVVMGAGSYIRQAGLLQLAAFWLSKREVEHQVLEDALLWLRRSQVTQGVCNQRDGLPTGAEPASLQWLLGCSAQEIALLEAEAEAYLGWLKRVVEGLWKEWAQQEPHEENDGAA